MLTEIVVSEDGAMRPDLVQHRDHLLALRERAHWKEKYVFCLFFVFSSKYYNFYNK